ncbi:MAG: nicotinate-nucleotide--dimethylbenzimidazole phosphoribosyltransferase [Alphaproteobacteria bacterium]
MNDAVAPPEIGSLDDVRRLCGRLPGCSDAAVEAAGRRQAELTKPAGSLGRLEELALWLAGWQGSAIPRAMRIRIVVFAGNHGIAARGVSAYPAAVTAEMVKNYARGGAAINQLAALLGAELRVVPLALDEPTADFTEAPAMSEAACLAAIREGMAAAEGGADLLCLGEMGIANTTSAAALCAALLGGGGADWAGRGTGIDDAGLARKRAAIDAGLARHKGALGDPLEAMRRLGGRELAAIMGAVLAARLRRVPVLLDGFACTAAALPLARLEAGALEHCRIGHCSAEAGHRRLIEALDMAPLVDLGMRLGEASGAALAALIVRAAAACHAGMATFAEAGVSGKEAQDS